MDEGDALNIVVKLHDDSFRRACEVVEEYFKGGEEEFVSVIEVRSYPIGIKEKILMGEEDILEDIKTTLMYFPDGFPPPDGMKEVGRKSSTELKAVPVVATFSFEAEVGFGSEQDLEDSGGNIPSPKDAVIVVSLSGQKASMKVFTMRKDKSGNHFIDGYMELPEEIAKNFQQGRAFMHGSAIGSSALVSEDDEEKLNIKNIIDKLKGE